MFTPLISDGLDQGDPFIVEVASHFPYRYYCYTTAGGVPVEGFAFTVYGSQDLRSWTFLGRALRADPSRAHWAPCVQFDPTAEFPFTMLYSQGDGLGDAAHRGHQLWVAVSDNPRGPFEPQVELMPDLFDFAIDPDLSRHSDGRLLLTFASDFVEGKIIGTGLWEAEISSDLHSLMETPRPIARPEYIWQIFDARRCMPWKNIPHVNWNRGDTVCWYCIEGPASITSAQGTRFIFYSGGNFEGLYGVGVLIEEASGHYRDLNPTSESCLIQSDPKRGFFAPGHGACLKSPHGEDYFVFHARFGSLTASRQFALARIAWVEGLPVLRPL